MSENAIVAETRENTGKGVARKLRTAGRIPAVLYGGEGGTRAISVDPKRLETVLHASGAGMNTLIDLSVDGKQDTVLLKALQRDPVRGRYLHADFYRIDLTQKIEVTVPIHLLGKAAGIEQGGVVDHPVRELLVECLPNKIPESIDVDVSALQIGDSIHVSELVLPEGVEVRTEETLAVATVAVPRVVEEEVEEGAEEEAAAGAEGAEAAADTEGGDEGGADEAS